MENQTQATLKEGDIVKRESASGFSLEGAYVANLTDKHFTIVGTRVEMIKSFEDPNELVEKVILSVQLSDGAIVDYYPNKTSMKTIIAKRGYTYANWINFEGEFETKNQRIGKEDRDVIYIKE